MDIRKGTRKDMVAFLIHYARRKGSLYFVDCSGVSVAGLCLALVDRVLLQLL